MQTQLLSANVFMFGPVHCFYALFTSVLDLVGRKSGRRGKAKQIKKKKSLGNFFIPWQTCALPGKLKEIWSVAPVETTCHLLSRYKKCYFSSSIHPERRNTAECFAGTSRPLETKCNHPLASWMTQAMEFHPVIPASSL